MGKLTIECKGCCKGGCSCSNLHKNTIRRVPKPWHIVLLILNVIFPGWGTMISACCDGKFDSCTFLVGLVQLLTSFLLIGWLWSIYWGWLIFRKSD